MKLYDKLLNNVLLSTMISLTQDPTGFYEPEDITVTYDNVARTVTLTGVIQAYFKGRRILELKNGWISPVHGNTAGSYFLYYNGTEFVWGSSPWDFSDLQICYVYYGATHKFGTREVHGFMPHSVHDVIHNTIGTYRVSGGDLSSYTPASTTATDRRPFISTCLINDEDLVTTCLAHTSRLYTKHYLTSTGTSNFTVETAEIVPVSGSQPYFNRWSGTEFVQTPMDNNTYMSVWLAAMPMCAGTNCQKYRFLWLQGQSNGSLVTEQGLSASSLNLGQLSTIAPEFIFLAKVILRYTGANWSITQVDSLRGSKTNQVAFNSGAYLSSVSVDGITITGDGTAGNPLVGTGGDISGKEDVANKENVTIDTSTTKYPTVNLLKSGLDLKQDTLVSATNIKTINSSSILGAGDLAITSGLTAAQVQSLISIRF